MGDVLAFKKKDKKRLPGHDAGFWDAVKSQNSDREKKATFSRAIKNKELIEAVQRGESVASIDTTQTWWPQRPVIKKDRALIEKLYGPTLPQQKNPCKDVSDSPIPGNEGKPVLDQ